MFKRKLSLFIALSFLTQICVSDIKDDLQDGALILAKQFHSQNQTFKAVNLISFILNIDNENDEALEFADIIKDKEDFRVYRSLPDNGQGYIKFLKNIIRENINMPKEHYNYLRFIGKIIDPSAPFPPIKNDNPYFRAIKKHFPDYDYEGELSRLPEAKQEVDEKLIRSLSGKGPMEIAKHLKVKNFTFNSQKLFYSINVFNRMLKPFRSRILISSPDFPFHEEIFQDGIKLFKENDLDVIRKIVFIKEATLYDIIKYIENTMRFTFVEDENYLVLTHAVNGEDGRPEKFKHAMDVNFPFKRKGLKNLVKNDFPEFRSDYHSKSIQLQGTITKIKQETNRLLVEIDRHFVAEVDNRILKPDTSKLIEQYLALVENDPEEAMKMLKVSVRGTIKARSVKRTDIINCYSILAIDKAHFYLKH